MNLRQALTLYASHTLSTWSARSYEFAAILFAAASFPHGLRATAFIGIANSIATILFGATIGRWIDRGQSRSRPLLNTISINKGAIITACVLWQFIIQEKANPADDREAEVQSEHSASVLVGTPKLVAFSLLLLLGVVEGLSRQANLIIVERDWVPVLAPPTVVEGRTLMHVNAVMGRIDIACRLLAPAVVSQFLTVVSPKTAASLFIFGNGISWGLEYITADRLYKMSDELQEPKPGKTQTSTYGSQQVHFQPKSIRVSSILIDAGRAYSSSFRQYFSTDVWAPSLAMCITHSSILSLAGVTVVFFLDSGYSMQLVAMAQVFSGFCELASTFLTPFAVRKIAESDPSSVDDNMSMSLLGDAGAAQEDFTRDESRPSATNVAVNVGLTQTGFFGIALMLAILIPTVPLLFHLTSELSYPMARYSTNKSPSFSNYPITSILLLGTLAISRLGSGILGLTTQQLGQSRVGPDFRGTFAGVEASFISLLGLSQNLGTAVFSDPRDFGVLATTSWLSLLCSTLLYLWWMNKEGVQWTWWKGRRKGQYHQVDSGG